MLARQRWVFGVVGAAPALQSAQNKPPCGPRARLVFVQSSDIGSYQMTIAKALQGAMVAVHSVVPQFIENTDLLSLLVISVREGSLLCHFS